jgi:peptidoglycan/xylan/chitin deacetylase (PgdA/CDA1 family)
MFHSIGIWTENWIWKSMSESLEVFESLLERLRREGYRTVGLSELYEHMSGRRALPGNSIVLTFDDGYLDNWVVVAPLLRKHGMKGVVYVSPEFVQDGDVVRPCLEDVWAGRVNQPDLEMIGFMNWAELKTLDDEQVLDVQCHGLTHTWYFSEPVVTDIHRPGDVFTYPWLSWNARPERKPYYLNEPQQEFVAWGHPVFAHEKALITKRFFPDASCVDEITQYVDDHGGARFFDVSDWRDKLVSRFGILDGTTAFPGHFESDTGFRERVLNELVESRRQLETRLNKEVRFLSWPGGGVNPQTAELAESAGYLSQTLSSWQQPSARNRPGSNPAGIKRVAGRSKVHWRGKWIANGGSWWIMQRALQHQGSMLSMLRTAVWKLIWILGFGRNVRP